MLAYFQRSLHFRKPTLHSRNRKPKPKPKPNLNSKGSIVKHRRFRIRLPWQRKKDKGKQRAETPANFDVVEVGSKYRQGPASSRIYDHRQEWSETRTDKWWNSVLYDMKEGEPGPSKPLRMSAKREEWDGSMFGDGEGTAVRSVRDLGLEFAPGTREVTKVVVESRGRQRPKGNGIWIPKMSGGNGMEETRENKETKAGDHKGAEKDDGKTIEEAGKEDVRLPRDILGESIDFEDFETIVPEEASTHLFGNPRSPPLPRRTSPDRLYDVHPLLDDEEDQVHQIHELEGSISLAKSPVVVNEIPNSGELDHNRLDAIGRRVEDSGLTDGVNGGQSISLADISLTPNFSRPMPDGLNAEFEAVPRPSCVPNGMHSSSSSHTGPVTNGNNLGPQSRLACSSSSSSSISPSTSLPGSSHNLSTGLPNGDNIEPKSHFSSSSSSSGSPHLLPTGLPPNLLIPSYTLLDSTSRPSTPITPERQTQLHEGTISIQSTLLQGLHSNADAQREHIEDLEERVLPAMMRLVEDVEAAERTWKAKAEKLEKQEELWKQRVDVRNRVLAAVWEREWEVWDLVTRGVGGELEMLLKESEDQKRAQSQTQMPSRNVFARWANGVSRVTAGRFMGGYMTISKAGTTATQRLQGKMSWSRTDIAAIVEKVDTNMKVLKKEVEQMVEVGRGVDDVETREGSVEGKEDGTENGKEV
ncbi:hypothetical protein P154DRAFT_576934 [Amniculicola lignicola CBS 123094]|uniref:Uncharacterized protein n=1 Tax=Amniculicola lignicola CBS 123094 TaxID=1392246 RepID=A0A6A5WK50_9PLEO|nr:hypothetical protein P154DRAFT_576934 [Amniculicola lignicola CBS 123094]